MILVVLLGALALSGNDFNTWTQSVITNVQELSFVGESRSSTKDSQAIEIYSLDNFDSESVKMVGEDGEGVAQFKDFDIAPQALEFIANLGEPNKYFRTQIVLDHLETSKFYEEKQERQNTKNWYNKLRTKRCDSRNEIKLLKTTIKQLQENEKKHRREIELKNGMLKIFERLIRAKELTMQHFAEENAQMMQMLKEVMSYANDHHAGMEANLEPDANTLIDSIDPQMNEYSSLRK